MNIRDFEDYISTVIVHRGEGYYVSQLVESLKADGNRYSAFVAGSDSYKVKVQLEDNGDIVNSSCDCPYDMGPYCKHEVAVYYTIRDYLRKPSYTPIEHGAEEIRTVLEDQNKEKLVDYLIELAARYPEVSQDILCNFTPVSSPKYSEQYRHLIHSSLNSYSDRDGYINEEDIDEALRGAEKVIDKAADLINTGEWRQALELCFCVLEELIPVLEYNEDCYDHISTTLHDALVTIGEIDFGALPEGEKYEFFEIILSKSQQKAFDSYDEEWRLDLIDICSTFADTPSRIATLEKYLLAILDNDPELWDYKGEKVAHIRYQLKEAVSEEQGNAFIEEHIRFPSFREMAIRNAMNMKDYTRVEQLAREGEMNSDSYFFTLKWREFRYQAYKQSRQLEKQRKLGMEYILQDKDHSSFQYYMEMKATYQPDQWCRIYPVILGQIKPKQYCSLYPSILIEEGETEKLMNYVRESPSNRISLYYQHLVPDFQSEVNKIFTDLIYDAAARTLGQ